MSKIFYIMGKSSSGKDTLFKEILKLRPDLKTIVLHTTRPIRKGEQDGVDYHFVTEHDIALLKAAGKIIEMRIYQTEHGPWTYATVKTKALRPDLYDYLAVGTPESFSELKKHFGPETVIPIYIEVDDGTRLERALIREKKQEHPKYAEMCRRFLADEQDFSKEKLNKAGIRKSFRNDDLETCLHMISEYMGGIS